MKILVCEYITGGGELAPSSSYLSSPSSSLWREAEVMVTALVGDLCQVPDLEVFYCRKRGCVPLACGSPVWVDVLCRDALGQDGEGDWRGWGDMLDRVDAVLPIAPETDGLLGSLVAYITRRGVPVMASTAEAIALTGCKRQTAFHLGAHGVATIPVYAAIPGYECDDIPAHSASGWVIKPADGVGAQGVRYFRHRRAVHAYVAGRAHETLIVQPYISGSVVSLCVIYDGEDVTLLSVNAPQVVRDGDGVITCPGVDVGVITDCEDCFLAVAVAVGRAIPGLRGYVGIDLIMDGCAWLVMDINPRLTASYVGLRDALGKNPAPYLLRPFGMVA